MNETPVNDPQQMKTDLEHLKLLSIFHYVLAAISGFFSLFPLIYMFFGILMLLGVASGRNNEDAAAGFMFICMSCCMTLPGLLIAVGLAMAGTKLKTQTGYTFCLIVAGVSCLFMPLGTILGVFTLITLNRPSVKQLFQDKENATQPVEVV